MFKSRATSLALKLADGYVGLQLETLRPLHVEKLIQNCNYLERQLQIIYCCLCTVILGCTWAWFLHSHWPKQITLGPRIWLVRPKQWQCESALTTLSFSPAKSYLSLFPPWCNFCGQVFIWQGVHQKQTKQTAFKQLWTNLFVVRTWSNLSQTQLLKELEFCCNFPTL